MGMARFKLVSWLLCTLAVGAFKLLDVGPPRTGTQTMHDAMKILGLKPLHTGYKLSVRHALCGPLFSMGRRGIYMDLKTHTWSIMVVYVFMYCFCGFQLHIAFCLVHTRQCLGFYMAQFADSDLKPMGRFLCEILGSFPNSSHGRKEVLEEIAVLDLDLASLCCSQQELSGFEGLVTCVIMRERLCTLHYHNSDDYTTSFFSRYLFGNGSLDDALAVFDGYDAAMDEPVMLMYEEIMAAFPEAKFLLTISDPESWFTNYAELARLHAVERNSSAKNFLGSLPANCTAMQSWGCNFGHTISPKDKDTCLKNYDRHIRRVQDVIPPERLLVYNWSDGWSPLSHFLGSRIPEEQFPHEDKAKLVKAAAKLGISLGS